MVLSAFTTDEATNCAIMLGALLGVLPLIALFFTLQRYWQSGLTAGAVKG